MYESDEIWLTTHLFLHREEKARLAEEVARQEEEQIAEKQKAEQKWKEGEGKQEEGEGGDGAAEPEQKKDGIIYKLGHLVLGRREGEAGGDAAAERDKETEPVQHADRGTTQQQAREEEEPKPSGVGSDT